MAAKNFEKGTLERKFFFELWEIVQKFYVPEFYNEEYWKEALSEVRKLTNSYKCTDIYLFACKMAEGYLDFLEVQSKITKTQEDAGVA